MSVIYMVRHGQASFGHENYDVLSRRGAEQSHMLGMYFLRTGVRFDAFYCGDMERQRRTADEIRLAYENHGSTFPVLKVMSALNEYDSEGILKALIPGLLSEEPQLQPDMEHFLSDRKSFQRVFERVMLRWAEGRCDSTGVESWADVKLRVAGALRAVMDENGRGKRVLVVASGGTISAAVQYAASLPDGETMRLCWQIVNSSVTRFKYDGKGIALASFNGYAHLEERNTDDLVTYR
jgi:broad specificity phosphatase PhoE